MNTKKIDRKSTLMIAHRGLSGLERENTLAAFIAAGNRSYYGIETDVHRTADGEFAIIHDPITDRVSGVSCNVENVSLCVTRSICLKDIDGETGRIDLRVPTLAEYIKTCKRYEKKCVLELKCDFTEEELIRIIDTFKAFDYLDEAIFISFKVNNLVILRGMLPEQKMQYLFDGFTDERWEYIEKYKLDIDAFYGGVNKEVVDRAHALGVDVNCWTVDDTEKARELVDMGVDFITTNIIE